MSESKDVPYVIEERVSRRGWFEGLFFWPSNEMVTVIAKHIPPYHAGQARARIEVFTQNPHSDQRELLWGDKTEFYMPMTEKILRVQIYIFSVEEKLTRNQRGILKRFFEADGSIATPKRF